MWNMSKEGLENSMIRYLDLNQALKMLGYGLEVIQDYYHNYTKPNGM